MIFIAVGLIVFFYLIVVMMENKGSKNKHKKKNVEENITDTISTDEKKFIQSNEKKSTSSTESTIKTSEKDTRNKPDSSIKSDNNTSGNWNQHGNESDNNDNDDNTPIIIKSKKLKPVHKSEEECRVIIESIFKNKFPTKRPDFLNNPLSKKNLELDCYCEELGIALEYNGIQHYKFPNPFHKNILEFKKQLQRDEYKKNMCRINDVLLIIIPYDMKKNKIRQYIIDCYNERLKMK